MTNDNERSGFMNCLEQILKDIKVGYFFDTHYVTDRAIKEHTDDYLIFAAQYTKREMPTLTAHRQIGHQIAKFEGTLVERQKGQSWSVNIHGNGGGCALWKRI